MKLIEEIEKPALSVKDLSVTHYGTREREPFNSLLLNSLNALSVGVGLDEGYWVIRELAQKSK